MSIVLDSRTPEMLGRKVLLPLNLTLDSPRCRTQKTGSIVSPRWRGFYLLWDFAFCRSFRVFFKEFCQSGRNNSSSCNIRGLFGESHLSLSRWIKYWRRPWSSVVHRDILTFLSIAFVPLTSKIEIYVEHWRLDELTASSLSVHSSQEVASDLTTRTASLQKFIWSLI